MHDYFDSYGCLKCDSRDAVYGGNGMCEVCYVQVCQRLKRCLKARFGDPKSRTSAAQVIEAIAGRKMALKLLRDLIPTIRTVSLSQQKYNAKNPPIGVRV